MDRDSKRVLRRAAAILTVLCAAAPIVSIAASHATLAAALLCLLAARERLRLPPIHFPLAVIFVGTLVSLAVSGHVVEGLPQVRKFYVFLILLAVSTTVRTIADAWRLVFVWVTVATLSALFGFVQFASKLPAALRPGVANVYEALVGDRITGFMSLWMTFGGQLAIVLAMLGGWLLFAENRRRWWPLLVGCGVVMAGALVLALTRGPWVGAAAGALYLVWAWKPKALLAVPVLAVVGLLVAPAALRDRVTSIVRPQSKYDSNQHRLVLWRTGWEMVKAHPWFGVGPEQVGPQFDSYVPADIPRPLPWGWRRHLHNSYVQYAAERGVPVLLALLWLLGKVLWDFRRAVVRSAPGNARALLHASIAALIAVMVGALFEHNLGDSEVLQMFLTVIALGYVAAGATASPVPAAGDEGPARGAAAGA